MENNRSQFARKIAVQTGKLLEDYFYHHSQEIDIKADFTLITEADRAANNTISTAIRREFPEDGILSEEENTIYPEQSLVWVIDPLDGTTNFSQGLHHWGVSIACLEQGQPVLATVYFPLVREHYHAELGAGAELNGSPLQGNFSDQPDRYSFFVHCSRLNSRYRNKLPYKTRSLGSAAYHLCLVAKGTAILAVETRAKLWDLAGAWLVVREAGGVIERFQNPAPFPAQPGVDYNEYNYPLLAASSRKVIQFAQDHIEVR